MTSLEGELILHHDGHWKTDILRDKRGFRNKHADFFADTLSQYLDVDPDDPALRILDPHWKTYTIYDPIWRLLRKLKTSHKYTQTPKVLLISMDTPSFSSGETPMYSPSELGNISAFLKTVQITPIPGNNPQKGFTLHDRWILGKSKGAHIGPTIKDIYDRDATITPINGSLFEKISERFNQLWEKQI